LQDREEAIFVLKQIGKRLTNCKLTLHPVKTRLVNLRGKSEKKYAKKYDFLGFTIRPQWCKVKGKGMLLPSIFINTKSETSIVEKFQKTQIHKKRITIEQLASDLRPIVRRLINYYGKFSTGHLRFIWNNLNKRILKWVKWEKRLYKMASVKWLLKKYRTNPTLFQHWALVHP